MEKKSIFKRIKDYFQKQKTGQKILFSLFKGTRKAIGIHDYEPVKEDYTIVQQTTEIEPDIVVYDEETIELKYVAIDKLLEMPERFSKKEYLWIKLMVTDERFLKAYFESTNAALVEYLEQLYKEGKFSSNILSAMEKLGMVVLSLEEHAKFINIDELYSYYDMGDIHVLFESYENKIESNRKKNS